MTISTLTMICLANSNKLGGRCIAGIELNDHLKPIQWIRLIGNDHPNGLTVDDYRYHNYQRPNVFDVVRVPIIEHQPSSYHVENWLINTSYYWDKRGEWDVSTTIKNLSTYIYDGPLWVNGYSSSTGTNNRIPESLFGSLKNSLQIILADDVTLLTRSGVDANGTAYRRLDVNFVLGRHEYMLRVTEPQMRKEYANSDDGLHSFPLGRCLMTISLGEPYKGFAYKLAAHIEPLTSMEFSS